MLEEFKIRRAIPADDSRLGELLIDAYEQTYAKKLPDVVVSEARKADLRDVAPRRNHACVLVIERSAEMVGSLTLFPPASAHSKSWRQDACEIRYMAIDRAFHGRGLSAFLLKEAKNVAESWGAAAITLHVRQTAKGVARMYMKNGFVRYPQGDLDELPEIFLEAYQLTLAPRRVAR